MTTELEKNKISIDANELSELLQSKTVPLLVFDLRPREDFASAHIDGSVHAVCDARAKETIMPKIPKDAKIVLVCHDGSISAPTAEMMKSYGFNTSFLQGGIKTWNRNFIRGNVDSIISAEDLWQQLSQDKEKDVMILDVREPDEFSDFRIVGSTNIPLTDLFKPEIVTRLPKDKKIVTVCPHGNRSMVAVFALARNGIEAKGLYGGLAAWGQVLSSKVIVDGGESAAGPQVIQVRKVGKGCLSYIIESNGEAVVIDPVYPAERYVELARDRGLKITKVMDTHQHADHVSAAKELARIAGAELLMSGYEQYDFESRRLAEDDRIPIGRSEIRTIHTPGHTAGSLSYLLDEKYLFTGDILFADGIGRPDLRDKANEFAFDLFGTMQWLISLPSNIVVLPGHHGEGIDATRGVSTTIENARKFPILQLSEKEFVDKVTRTVLPRPMNYEKIIHLNKLAGQIRKNDISDLEMGPNRCAISAS